MAGSVFSAVAPAVIGGIMGGGSPSAPNVQVWQPPGLDAAATQWQDLVKQNQGNNPYAAYADQFKNIYANQGNNPYAPGAQTAANNAGQAYTNIGNQNIAASGQINNAALNTLPYAQQVAQMGLDPQGDLYKRTVQQLQDQIRVGQSARGITSSPYGANLEAQEMGNFNIDWQNNALQRAMSGLDSYNKGVTSAAGGTTSAGNLGAAGAGAIQQGGAAPYTTSTGISNDQYDALANLMNALTGSNTVNQQTIDNLMKYMGLGAGQSNAQGNADLANYQNQLTASDRQNAGAQQIGGAVGQIGGSWLNAPSSTLPWMSNASNLTNQLGYFLS